MIVGAGPWRVARSDIGQPFYCVVLEGSCCIEPDKHEPLPLQSGDFVLVPAIHDFVMASPEPLPGTNGPEPVMIAEGKVRVGNQEGPTDLRMLVGHCRFDSPDAGLLVSLLPRLVHVRGEARLTTLVKLVGGEARAQRPARDIVLSRLLEVLFIEALRTTTKTTALPGLVRGLIDARVGGAIRAMHQQPSRPWTMADLARKAALSRSAFFDRFKREVGVAPMAYLLTWRMALAKQMLQQGKGSVADIAEKAGYRSASSFSVAFSRHVGRPPAQYARDYR